jgi:dihydroorotate dehydrogenase electron transfer subunit
MDRPHRGTIFCEDAQILAHARHPGEQYVLRLQAPACARAATPGTFVHVRCNPQIPMRRPLSIMGANAEEGWIEVLYKVVGQGLSALARVGVGERVSLLGPIGRGFRMDPERPRPVLIAGGVGIPPLVFLADRLGIEARIGSAAFLGSELPFPFPVVPSRIPMAGVPAAATAGMAHLEERNVASRLASQAGLPGCFRGFVTELARAWIEAQPPRERQAMTIYACGPTPMLRATKALAGEFGLPAQLCLEEFMACAVGGCAGCVVPVLVDGQRQMKRVCVDGPVFDGSAVFAT